MIHGPRTKFADEGLVITFTFSRITRQISQFGNCQFNIITRNKKAIFLENFSSWLFDLGKIFKIILFSCGPRTPYCNPVSIQWSRKRTLVGCCRTYTGCSDVIIKLLSNFNTTTNSKKPFLFRGTPHSLFGWISFFVICNSLLALDIFLRRMDGSKNLGKSGL